MAFCGFWHACAGRSNADAARLCVSVPRGQRGANICYVCELATLVAVLLKSGRTQARSRKTFLSDGMLQHKIVGKVGRILDVY